MPMLFDNLFDVSGVDLFDLAGGGNLFALGAGENEVIFDEPGTYQIEVAGKKNFTYEAWSNGGAGDDDSGTGGGGGCYSAGAIEIIDGDTTHIEVTIGVLGQPTFISLVGDLMPALMLVNGQDGVDGGEGGITAFDDGGWEIIGHNGGDGAPGESDLGGGGGGAAHSAGAGGNGAGQTGGASASPGGAGGAGGDNGENGVAGSVYGGGGGGGGTGGTGAEGALGAVVIRWENDGGRPDGSFYESMYLSHYGLMGLANLPEDEE